MFLSLPESGGLGHLSRVPLNMSPPPRFEDKWQGTPELVPVAAPIKSQPRPQNKRMISHTTHNTVHTALDSVPPMVCWDEGALETSKKTSCPPVSE